MFKTPLTTLKITVIAAALGAVFPSLAMALESFDPAKEEALPAEERAFVNINPAIKMAPAYGNRAVGAHGSFGQFPANFETPLHTHTNAYHGIVIKGQMTNPFKGEQNPPVLGPGSYWYVPAMMEHSTACVSDTPCEFYFHADSAFDFKPVE
jgi:mannose-6-phosphate isomerase-like protein (cupin superfamily)